MTWSCRLVRSSADAHEPAANETRTETGAVPVPRGSQERPWVTPCHRCYLQYQYSGKPSSLPAASVAVIERAAWVRDDAEEQPGRITHQPPRVGTLDSPRAKVFESLDFGV